MKELATIDTTEIKISKVEAFVEIKPENGTDFQEARDFLRKEFSGENIKYKTTKTCSDKWKKWLLRRYKRRVKVYSVRGNSSWSSLQRKIS